MSQVPVVVSNGQPPAMPQAMMEQYQLAVASMSEGFGGAFNYIRPGKLDFKLVENGVARTVPNGAVVGVLLGVSPVDFCTWYEKAYQPGQEPEQPDLVWEWPNHATFPDALPTQFRQKIMQNGKERWAFRVARRSVWAILNEVNGQYMLNLDTPYILDITSMSMFGKSEPQNNVYKFSGLMSMCQRMSQPGFSCSPAMFFTQLAIDAASPVSGVINFRPRVENGQLSYLDNATFQSVLHLMFSDQVKDMLKVKEKLTCGNSTQPQVQPTAAPVQPAQPVVQPVALTPPTATVAQPVQPVAPVQPPVGQPVQPVALTQPVLTPSVQTATQPPAAPVQPTAVPSEDLLAQAQAALNQPAGQQMPIAPGVNQVTAQAVNALNSML